LGGLYMRLFETSGNKMHCVHDELFVCDQTFVDRREVSTFRTIDSSVDIQMRYSAMCT
jgi:hypothetical protein